ncbi:hypothetical protein V493_07649, partial [Pseudogymnoascus sp. VKM F-4281 (FW-2241)]
LRPAAAGAPTTTATITIPTKPTMLLPALCPPSRRAPLSPSLFASPPASPSQPATSSHSALLATCRALQSMLASPQPQKQLPTPPMRHAPLPSPMKLRLRSSTSRPSSTDASAVAVAEAPLPSNPIPRKKIVKRASPRGAGKRRRGSVEEEVEEEEGPRTPKRSRGVPETMPLGLARRDFESLHNAHQYRSDGTDALGIVGGPVEEPSTVEEEGGEEVEA